MAEPEIWTKRSGTEIENQMWTFKDKGNRPVTLIPEATALVRSLYMDSWSKCKPKPVKVFYATRCYRVERPQLGRYREFTQFGVEILGPGDYEEEAKQLLRKCLDSINLQYDFDEDVIRGLSYYTRQGFEASCSNLGAQKQVAGGGSYDQGCGWAIGVDRVVISKMM